MIDRRVDRGSRQLHLLLVAAALAIVAAAGVATLARGADAPSQLQMLVGRLHPLIVHLPIGFLLIAAALEVLTRVPRLRRIRHAVPVVLVLSAASAVAAALAGYLLATTGGYVGPTVAWHERFGIAVAIVSTVAPVFWYLSRVRRSLWFGRAYRGSLAAAVALVVAAGHLGGTLTRGPNYLAEYMPGPLAGVMTRIHGEATPAPSFGRIDEARVYDDLVRPVLAMRCTSCHGPEVQKGGLRLDSPEGILKGGTSGHTVVAGRAAESEIIRRIWLPDGHEDVMPPAGRRPPNAVEAELIRWWVDQGASFEQTIADAQPPAGVLAILDHLAGPAEARLPAVLRTPVEPADPAALETARALGVSIVPLSSEVAFLRAHCRTTPSACGSEQIAALVPLAGQLTELDLGGTRVSDDDLAAIGGMRHLTRLHLDRTNVTDTGLAHLEPLEHLEYLNLYQTAITDAGLERLTNLRSLRSLYIWHTRVTPEAVERLRSERPSLTVYPGVPLSTAVDRAF